jgi:hypothetical protein
MAKSALVVFVAVERGRGKLVGAASSQQDLDFLLRLLERALARTRELHAALEVAQRVVQGQVALFELVDDRFQLGERAFEVGRGFGDGFGGGRSFAGHDVKVGTGKH